MKNLEDGSGYIKPIKKNTYSTEFVDDKNKRKIMELSRVPLMGEFFRSENLSLLKISKVIYLPWNEFAADIEIRGEREKQD